MNRLKLFCMFLDAKIREKAFAVGFDVTNKCNLHCHNCYWWTQEHYPEMSLEKIREFFVNLKKEGITHCTYVGGEPTLRPDVLEVCTKIIPYNWIITNGTTVPPDVNNALFGLSVDGTQKVHDDIRMNGLYQKIWDNYSCRSKTFITTTLMNANKNEPEKLLKEWSNTSILGMAFNFATPFTNSDNTFWMPWSERDKVIDKLIQLKHEYGDFILMTRKQLELLRRENVEKWSKNCTMKWFSKSFYSNGKQKFPCILGECAICNRCGCHISTVPNSVFKLDFEVVSIFNRLFGAQG